MKSDMRKHYEARGTVRGDMLLLPPNVALEFLKDSQDRQIEVFGFDGFRLQPGNKIQPLLEHSLDLSSSQYRGLTRDEKFRVARLFIQKREGTDILFEMVADDE
jgi:hypothetical protein